jgi:ArsR family transcriptional regulator
VDSSSHICECCHILNRRNPVPDDQPTPSLTRPLSEIKAELFRALSNPARIRVLEVLAAGARSVGQMAPLVGIELSHLSQQLAVLRRARLVRTRKEGSTVYYDVGDPAVVGLLAAAKQVLINQLAGTEELLVGLRTEGRST